MEVIKEKILIKEVRGMTPDVVFPVKNMRKDLIYDERGNLRPGIAVSQTGDGSLVFDRGNREASDRLDDIDRYIVSVYPSPNVPKRIINQVQEGHGASPALTAYDLERKMHDSYGVNYLELSIPDDDKAISFEARTEAKKVASSFEEQGYFDPHSSKDKKSEKSNEIDKRAVEDATENLKCVACGYKAFTITGLKIHIGRYHKQAINKEAALKSG